MHLGITDTSPIIRKLEELYPGKRSVIPHHPGLCFLNSLIEDYADEWSTKHMFHYRWGFDRDIKQMGLMLPLLVEPFSPPRQVEQMAKFIADRQVQRLADVVGGGAGAVGEVLRGRR